MTTQLTPEKEERKPLITPVTIVMRIGSIRVSYMLVLTVVGWFAFSLVIYILRILGFIDGR